jgi:acyl-CoA synthetase (NDP forming)
MSSPDLFEKCLEVLARDSGVDSIVACFAVLVGSDVERIANALGDVRKIRELPIAVARTGSQELAPEASLLFKKKNLPVFPTPDRAVAALRILNESARASQKISSIASGKHGIPSAGASEVELKAIWAAAGVPVPLSEVVDSADQVLAAIAKVGGRSVMKAIVPGLLHKSEAGGVALDITESNGLETFERLSQLQGKGVHNSVLVETFVPKGVEALVGVTSSSLGKVLTIGVGGILTEIISDVSVRLLPVNSDVIREMINETRLQALFAGPRGSAPSDVDTFISTVMKIAEVVTGWPDGSELDINPLTVLPKGAYVLDSAYSSGPTTEGNHH